MIRMTDKPKKKILIFDNSEILVDMMTVVMMDEGYEAMGMPFTANFMQIILDYKPDLLLLDDNKANRLNAYDLGLQIKINPKTGHIPVIMLSIYESQEMRKMNEYIPDVLIIKPFSLTKLTWQVEQLLSLKISN
jgi:response regulator RpfG family c-di-GMP phosphodiesterase